MALSHGSNQLGDAASWRQPMPPLIAGLRILLVKHMVDRVAAPESLAGTRQRT